VMSVGKKCDISSLGRLPENFIVKNYVPQLEILKHTDVFISHGGFNSVSEALYNEVPIIAIPMVNDQFMVAQRLAKLGAGIPLKMNEITPEILKASVDNLLSEPAYKEASRKISESFHHGDGLAKAADYILNLGSENRI
jgi:glycosyltransferase, MGT family